MELSIHYKFKFLDKKEHSFHLHFDSKHFDLVNFLHDEKPSWTKLGFNKCPHCPLSEKDHTHCPAAVNMVTLVEMFKKHKPDEEVCVYVDTPEKSIVKQTNLKEGATSLMGLLIGTSDCPHTYFFRPMARYHLPFATEEETAWRAVSAYTLFDFFRNRETPEKFDLEKLGRFYRDIQVLNGYLISRLKEGIKETVVYEGLKLLDVYAKSITPVLEKDLERIRSLFEPFLNFKEKAKTESPQ